MCLGVRDDSYRNDIECGGDFYDDCSGSSGCSYGRGSGSGGGEGVGKFGGHAPSWVIHLSVHVHLIFFEPLVVGGGGR